MPCAPGIRPEPTSIEMSGFSTSLVLTQGAINLWFGRKADKALIAKILVVISKVDARAEHEKEVLCRFEEISEFENNGYILTSYARRGDRYRAIFVVPFSDSRALDKFIDSVADETERGEVKMTLHWSGGTPRMNILKDEMDKLKCFSFINATYKVEQEKTWQEDKCYSQAAPRRSRSQG
jgi:hypothetical protein